MNWEAFGAISEGLGAIAVIMSVLYLAIQIRAQTKEERLAATRDLAAEYRRAIEHMFQDKELASLTLAGKNDYKALADEDRVRVSLVWGGIFRAMEQQYLHTCHGSIDPIYLSSIDRSKKEFLSFPGVQTWWHLSTHGFHDEFCEHVEELIAEANATEFQSSFKQGEERDE
ncbi:MAG: hypothetical protein V7717_09400 [Porticoccaceae bacterium]